MPSKLNDQEEKALVAALLDLPEDEEVMDFVVVVHFHKQGSRKCEGLVRSHSNCTKKMTAGLMKSALAWIGSLK